MKKYICFIPLFVLGALLFAGCGPSEEEMATMTAAAWTPTPSPTLAPPPTSTNTPLPPTETPTPTVELQDLIITFDPNSVTPYKSSDGSWVWKFTFDIYNPNDFPVKIIAIGEFMECLDDMSDCAYTGEDFKDWFTGCGEGSASIAAGEHACDKEWWISFPIAPPYDVSGQYAVYFEDENGEIHLALSEILTVQKP
jgi:hypothetical protein